MAAQAASKAFFTMITDHTVASRIRVGILGDGFLTWAGGVDFLRMLVDSLRLGAEGEEPDLVVLAPQLLRRSTVRTLCAPWYRWARGRYGPRGMAQLREALRDQRTFLSPDWQRSEMADAFGRDTRVVSYSQGTELDSLAQQNGIACLLPSIRPLSPDMRTPWIGYVYDFQHRHLAHLFSQEEHEARNKSFSAMAASSRYLLVNSQNTRQDCARFLGGDEARFVALPFGAAPQPDWLRDDHSLIDKYRLPRRYFLVANQFWKHKNHPVVFKALRLLREAPGASDIGLVCTGSTFEPRDGGYFPSLLQSIRRDRLSDRVRILGFVPKRDQIEIMKNAIAVVQPTLFEGGPGGGALYDAVSLGVPGIVSDLPVNRELEATAVPIAFFEPSDARTLAALMLDRASKPVSRPEAQTLIAQGQARRRAVGRVLWTTIRCAIGADTSREPLVQTQSTDQS